MSTTTTELNLETILYAKKGAIAYVTLNRPKVLNALNKKTWEDLKAAFEDAQEDATVRGVILCILERGLKILPRSLVQSVEDLRPIESDIGNGAFLGIQDSFEIWFGGCCAHKWFFFEVEVIR